ncbi:MAG: ATP-binding protein [Pseudomonadota bacterium]|nr:ATP-binding protein [Pseudomonadota bacterium]
MKAFSQFLPLDLELPMTPQPDISTLSMHFAFRLMIYMQGHRQLLQHRGIADVEVARSLGLGEFVEVDTYDRQHLQQQLRRNARCFAEAGHKLAYPEPLGINLQALARMLGLNSAACQVLGLCALMHSDSLLHRCITLFGGFDNRRLVHTLALLLQLPPGDIQIAMGKGAPLFASGLLEVDYAVGDFHLCDRLSFSSPDLLDQLCHHRGATEDLFRHSFRISEPGLLSAASYPHLEQEIDIALRFLRKSQAQSRVGVNVLIYGPPGTGKTELCRLLASELGSELYEIAVSDRDGDPIPGHQRLCALRSAMHVLRGSQALVLLDEIEDIFHEHGNSSRRLYKSWVNRVLEENNQPCFWLSNDIRELDSAYIRRFDLIIEATNPARQSREQILLNLGAGRLGQDMLGKLTSHDALSPAVFKRAYEVARMSQPRAGRRQNQVLERILDATLKAQGHAPLERSGDKSSRLPGLYSPALVNTDIALDDLLAGLRRCPQARLCFYGRPGTGKTAFAHWLADSLSKPVLVKRCSDLIGPLVGQTEQNLAAAFSQAQETGAVLVLDEVDSFLQDRSKAKHTWEVTGVNEMLTQMEAFDGLFIASTNLMNDLDEAALRRFDLKVNFKALRAEQIVELFQSHILELKLKDPQQLGLNKIVGLNNLAPGDFAAVARRARFKPFSDGLGFADALVQEVGLKRDGVKRTIGFVN